jgi:hypothetical protein
MRRYLPLILIALACAKPNDGEKLRKSIVSWKATLRIVADARLKDNVRDGFALKTIDEAVDDLEGQSSNPADKGAAQLIGQAATLRQAIERHDKAAMANAAGELAR